MENHFSSTIEVERATPADVAIIQKLNQELCINENKNFDATINPEYPFSEAGTNYFKGRIESSDALALVARDGKTIVGYLVGGMAKREDYRLVGPIAELENMYVSESVRNKGVGKRLTHVFEAWCRERGVKIIRIIASFENNGAIRFYKKFGAKPVCTTLEKELI